ncbi:MAG: L-threonylcarbamoyladenylate synthase [Actinomycetota bacterium]|nr:L-threonylcarbamoyladenylate synthase [Actinomycetota bacterium]
MTSPYSVPIGSVPLTRDLDRAAGALAAGGLVGMPTETVYGLAADAANADAVARVYAVKGRPRDHPLILHVASSEGLDRYGADVPDSARRLAEACWPGPLTVLVGRSAAVPDGITGGRSTVAIRVPAHPLATGIIERLNRAVVAPSANRFGRVSPTTPRHVLDELGDALDPDRDLVLDGGATTVGIESTIVDCTTPVPQVLRPGAITAAEIERIVGGVAAASGPARAPGMLVRHYSPVAAVEVFEDREAAERRQAQLTADGVAVDVLHVDDSAEYARVLYQRLRAADDAGVAFVLAVLPSPEGIGIAVRDRLHRASAGR